MDAVGQDAKAVPPGELKSPTRILLRSFRQSRQKWKAKALQRRTEVKVLEHKVRDVGRSRARWKAKAKQVQAVEQALRERLQAVEAERDRLQAQVAELASKKARTPGAR